MNVIEVIQKKRDKKVLSKSEIQFLIQSYTKGLAPDYQMSSFLMAALLNGLNREETFNLTEAMLYSGEVINLKSIPGVKVDKHSTGGVGDGTSLVVAPLAAACGVVVPMMSGRSLGHTGGTLDKLESMPGFNVSLSLKSFKKQLSKIGVAMIGQTAAMAPADRKLYALRDVTGTVESISLICASILSKKFAEGIDALVLDVKTGSGAFMSSYSEALKLAKAMKEICNSKKIKNKILITNMDEPLGFAVGNALELKQALEVMKNSGPRDFTELSLTLTANMIQLAGIEKNYFKAYELADKNLKNGKALEVFRAIVKAQGANPRLIDDPNEYLPQAGSVVPIKALRGGFINSINAREVGMASAILGASRFKKDDLIDYSAGIVICKKVGDRVERSEPLAYLHFNDKKRLAEAHQRFIKSIVITSNKPSAKDLICSQL